MGEQLEGEEAVSQPASADEQRFFFGHVLHEWIKPIVLPIVVAYLTVRLVTPSGDEHDIALSVIRSNNGTKEITSAPDPFSDPFGLTGVIVVATAAPATQFTYTVVVTNSGDYPEDDVQTAISFQGDEGVYQVMSGPEIDASSGLLRDTVSLLSATPEHSTIAYIIPRLNPGEWFSVRTTWSGPEIVRVETRSNAIATSITK